MARSLKSILSSPFVKVPFRYGCIAGFLGSSLILVLFAIHRHPFLIPVFFDFRIILFGIFIFFAGREFRELNNNGALYFWQGMGLSFVFIIVFAILVSLFIYIVGVLRPDFVTTYIAEFTARARLFPAEVIEQIGKEDFEQRLEVLKATTIVQMAGLYFFQCLAIGLFVSIIISVILRKQPEK